MIPPNFLTTLATQWGISESELEVLSKAIQGESMETISQQLGIQTNALQKRLGGVYKKFQIHGGGPGKLAKLQQMLISEYQKVARNYAPFTDSTPSPSVYPSLLREPHQPSVPSILPRLDWEDIPDTRLFWGRTSELTTLEQWIVKENSPVIAIVGMGGIGKTALAAYLTQKIQSSFDVIIGRSLLTSPTLLNLLTDITKFLFNSSTPTTENLDQLILKFIQYLHSSRCLIILNEVETILEDSVNTQYRSGFENYEAFFQMVAESAPKSCLILTSWRIPLDVEKFSPEASFFKILSLQGLPEKDAQNILLYSPGFSHLESGVFAELTRLYRGHPLLLRLVADFYQDLAIENLAQFIKETTFTLNKLIENYLKQELEDSISELAKDVICWLAIKGQPAAIKELQSNSMLEADPLELITSLKFLTQHFLVKEYFQAEENVLTISPHLQQIITHRLLAKYFNKLGYKKYLEGEFKSAKSFLKQAIRYHPNLIAAQYNLGATYEQLQEGVAAKNLYQKIINHSHHNAAHAAFSNLTRLEILESLSLEEFNQKIESVIQGILLILPQVIDGKVKAALLKNLGWAYWLKNQREPAEVYLRQSLELDQERAVTHGLLAQVLEAKGDPKAALEFWQNCLKYEVEKKAEGNVWKLPELNSLKLQAFQRINALNYQPKTAK